MVDGILIAILAIAVGGAALYIYKAKKSGQHCIGCPYAKQCATGQCSCENGTIDETE